MSSSYPTAIKQEHTISFKEGALVSLPIEYTKAKNRVELSRFYEDIFSKNNDELIMGTDPLGFDFVFYKGACTVGLLIGLTNSSLANNNRKKYPFNKFERRYITERVIEERKLNDLEEFIPIQIVTQNVHELRNLNFKISSSVDEILDVSSESEWEEKFEKANENIKKIYVSSRLIKFILDNMRLFQPNYIETLRPNTDRYFSIHKSLNKIVKIYSNEFKKNPSQITLEGSCYKMLNGDKELFEIILMLLIENSIKYSNDASKVPPKVRIKDINPIVTISIHSFGKVIMDDEIDKLFTRGFRSRSNNPSKEGTGMGLHNANKLVGFFDGELSYSKEVSAADSSIGWNVFTITCHKVVYKSSIQM